MKSRKMIENDFVKYTAYAPLHTFQTDATHLCYSFSERLILTFDYMFRKKVISPFPNDDSLIFAIKGNEAERNIAVLHILNQEGDKIKSTLLSLVQDKDEVDDIFYEGMAAFVLNVRKGLFEQNSKISTYIIAICKRIWFKKLRKKQVHQKWEETQDNEISYEHSFPLISNELKQNLNKVLSTLKDKCKEVLNLWALNYNMTEIAEQLGYQNSQVVMNKKNLCLKEIRIQIQQNPSILDLLN
ncbi:MAG: sigma-70 family RNA polymerase sigma factor [Flavobacteriales bacterium]|nr:sigma-70 family RNA polymerase sigma factor [Flavobacteriales bacterium]